MLILPIKKKYFDMIASGEKKEEYREIKPYWTSRLLKYFHFYEFRTFERYILLRNGYGKGRPTLRCKCRLKIGQGRPELRS